MEAEDRYAQILMNHMRGGEEYNEREYRRMSRPDSVDKDGYLWRKFMWGWRKIGRVEDGKTIYF